MRRFSFCFHSAQCFSTALEQKTIAMMDWAKSYLEQSHWLKTFFFVFFGCQNHYLRRGGQSLTIVLVHTLINVLNMSTYGVTVIKFNFYGVYNVSILHISTCTFFSIQAFT
jgi:hypothetical protein